ncbi:hypothetical protein B4U80_10382 [Leptotrombidium deliense]|uniref:C-type lectin domain-containing protein n=1 Tax=Leptotrombidium deliense TaxID=299467 RepID=A0A443RXI6_9ACAR|nr:hypothetical protein B4U80_10382 [Leptotrombidium deliense]
MKDFCESINASLPVLHSYRDNVMLQQAFPALATYLGAQRDINDFNWIDGLNHTYYRWTEGEPNNSGGIENCIEFENGGDNNGRWNDIPCRYAHHTVCILKNCDDFIAKQRIASALKIQHFVDKKMNETKNLFPKLISDSEFKLNDFIKSENEKQNTELKSYIDSKLMNESDILYEKIVAALETNPKSIREAE